MPKMHGEANYVRHLYNQAAKYAGTRDGPEYAKQLVHLLRRAGKDVPKKWLEMAGETTAKSAKPIAETVAKTASKTATRSSSAFSKAGKIAGKYKGPLAIAGVVIAAGAFVYYAVSDDD